MLFGFKLQCREFGLLPRYADNQPNQRYRRPLNDQHQRGRQRGGSQGPTQPTCRCWPATLVTNAAIPTPEFALGRKLEWDASWDHAKGGVVWYAAPFAIGLILRRGAFLHFLGQTLPGHVQPSLDRADGGREMIAHFNQRLTTNIEGF